MNTRGSTPTTRSRSLLKIAAALTFGVTLANADSAHGQGMRVIERPDLQLSLPGQVRAAVVQADGRIVIGGWFDLVQRAFRQGVARINADGTLDAKFDLDCRGPILSNGTLSNCAVLHIVELGDASLIVSGHFAQLGGYARAGIARLRPDGTVDPDWNPLLNGADGEVVEVLEIARETHSLIVGVRTAAGIQHRRVSTTGSGAIDPQFSAGPAVAQVVADAGGDIFARRTVRGGDAIVRLVRATGAIDPEWTSQLPDGAQIDYIRLHPVGGWIFALGTVTAVNGSSTPQLLRVDPHASTPFDSNWRAALADESIATPQQSPDVQLHASSASGLLVHIDQGADHAPLLLRLDAASGAVLDRYVGSIKGGLPVVGVDREGKILVSPAAPDNPRSPLHGGSALMRLDQNLRLDTTFETTVRAAGGAHNLALSPDGSVVITGDFTRVGDALRNKLARLRPDLELDQNFVSDAGGSVQQGDWLPMAISDDGFTYLGLNFMSPEFTPLAAVLKRIGSASGMTDPNWGHGTTAAGSIAILAFDASSRFLYAGANSTGTLCGTSAHRAIMRLTVNTGCQSDLLWQPALAGLTHEIEFDRLGRIYLAGDFNDLDGNNRRSLVRINAGATAFVDATWVPAILGPAGYPYPLRALAIDADHVYVAGHIHSIASQPWAGIARVSQVDGGLDTLWNAGDADVAPALALDGIGNVFSSNLIAGSPTIVRRGGLQRRAASGNGQPLDSIAFGGPVPYAQRILGLPNGGAIAAGWFILSGRHVTPGLVLVSSDEPTLFANSFESATTL